jgi:hypothetical protein
LFTEYKGLEAQLGLSSVPVEIGLKDLYEGVIGEIEWREKSEEWGLA